MGVFIGFSGMTQDEIEELYRVQKLFAEYYLDHGNGD